MRIIIFVFMLLLSGCAGLSDRITGSQTAAAKLRTELGADIDLRLALQRDLARKNAQLEYVSDHGYTCGSDNPYFRENRVYKFRPLSPAELEARKKRRIKFVLATYAPLAVIVAYGDALSAAITKRADRKEANDLFQKIVTTFAPALPSEFQAAPALIGALAKFENLAEDYYLKLAIIQLAHDYDPLLKKAKDEVVAKNIAKALTETEDEAFRAWDECALDRLYFLREFDPQLPPAYIKKRRDAIIANTRGEGRSPVIQFAMEYKIYLDEKEAFIGQRPDYLAAINRVVEGNAKLANFNEGVSFKEFEQAIVDVGTDAFAEKAQYDAIIMNLKTAGIIR
jgi:hypothetical protein